MAETSITHGVRSDDEDEAVDEHVEERMHGDVLGLHGMYWVEGQQTADESEGYDDSDDDSMSDEDSDDAREEEWTEEHEVASRTKRKYTFSTRNRSSKKKSRQSERWDSELPQSSSPLKSMNCCVKLKCFQVANADYLHEKMKESRHFNVQLRKDFLNSMFTSNSTFHFDGREVCSSFLLESFRLTRMMQSNIRKFRTSNDDYCTAHNSISTSERASPQRDAIVSFLERLADNTGDCMPDRNEYHLPFFKKQEVFTTFEKEYDLLYRGKEKPSTDYFYRTWKIYCPHVKVRKHTRFSKCDTCENCELH